MTPAIPFLLIAEDRTTTLQLLQELSSHFSAEDIHPVCRPADLKAALVAPWESVVLAGDITWENARQAIDSVAQARPRTRVLFLFAETEADLAAELLQEERVTLALARECAAHDLRSALALARAGSCSPAGAIACLACLARNPTGFFRCLPDGRILDANAALARQLGYISRAELMVAAPPLWPAGRPPHSDHANGLCDLALPHRRGKPCWGRLFVQPLLSPSGEVIAFEGWVENADRTHLFQTALHRTHQRYRQLLDALPVPVMIGNRDGIVTDANAALERLSGYQRHEIIGKKPMLDFVAEQNRGLMARYHQLRHAGEPAPTSYEFGFRCRSGEIRPMRVTVCYLPEQRRTIAVGEDLADHNRKERGLRLVAAALAGAGPGVFPALAANLSAGLETSGALIVQVATHDSSSIEVLAAARSGRSETLAPFDWRDSACAALIRSRHQFLHQADGARAAFPQDRWLARLAAEVFVGLPLIGTDGRRIGAILIAHHGPVRSIRFCKALLQLAASRVVAELAYRPRPEHASPPVPAPAA